jgi:hypothetical protein
MREDEEIILNYQAVTSKEGQRLVKACEEYLFDRLNSQNNSDVIRGMSLMVRFLRQEIRDGYIKLKEEKNE